ncbi:MAG: winged helix DNA-binding domain-containing protein [Candidatus Heimdallarchaeota archaeon]|nr:winged helix DNA-binding domain-containing protein [Candidatus Heimdallarchaeota archaeon]
MKLNADDIKKIHLQNQFLLFDSTISHPKLSISQLLNQIGYIQIDTIQRIARAHELTIHTRVKNYKQEEVWLKVKNGEVFEWFCHARSLLPIGDFPFYYGAMLANRKKPFWFDRILNKHPEWPKQVLRQIDIDGPITIRDITLPDKIERTSGWSSPQKLILDYLLYCGYILPHTRVKFSHQYDLIDRIVKLPDEIPDSMERFWFHINRSLQANGPSYLHRLLHYNYNHSNFEHHNQKQNPRKLIKDAVSKGTLLSIPVEGSTQHIYFLPDQEIIIPEISKENELVHFINPFDNVLWSRESLLEQYNFDYKVEIYVPEKKRKYGYYVLPILYGIRFVGRVDVNFIKDTETLMFNKWYWEDGFSPINDDFLNKIAKTIVSFRIFHLAKSIELGNLPQKVRTKLLYYLKLVNRG